MGGGLPIGGGAGMGGAITFTDMEENYNWNESGVSHWCFLSEEWTHSAQILQPVHILMGLASGIVPVQDLGFLPPFAHPGQAARLQNAWKSSH